MQIDLGDRVTDVVTGYMGIVTGRCEYINGCVQFLVKPPVIQKDDGTMEMQNDCWIDQERLAIRDKGAVTIEKTIPGFDTKAPSR